MEGVEYVIKEGGFVLAAPGVSMMDKKIWGSGALEFDENRWLGEKAPVEEDEAGEEEDYGWGKISKGGKSACEFLFRFLVVG